jgi:hypothetical protein
MAAVVLFVGVMAGQLLLALALRGPAEMHRRCVFLLVPAVAVAVGYLTIRGYQRRADRQDRPAGLEPLWWGLLALNLLGLVMGWPEGLVIFALLTLIALINIRTTRRQRRSSR